MEIEGKLSKLLIDWDEKSGVQYSLNLGGETVNLNKKINQEISLSFNGQINCVSCSIKIKKSYGSGSCYNCYMTLAQNDFCIFKPETCHFHLGTCRDSVWGENNCFQEHCIYLANSSHLKVGITKNYKRIKRWLDQGASEAIVLATVKTRYQSGLVEDYLKEFLQDKTNWRKMLQGSPEKTNLEKIAKEYKEKIRNKFNFIKISQEKPHSFSYPIEQYPEKIKSYNFDKDPIVTDILKGMKGQYLIFEKSVLNLKKFSGYFIKFTG